MGRGNSARKDPGYNSWKLNHALSPRQAAGLEAAGVQLEAQSSMFVQLLLWWVDWSASCTLSLVTFLSQHPPGNPLLGEEAQTGPMPVLGLLNLNEPFLSKSMSLGSQTLPHVPGKWQEQ